MSVGSVVEWVGPGRDVVDGHVGGAVENHVLHVVHPPLGPHWDGGELVAPRVGVPDQHREGEGEWDS